MYWSDLELRVRSDQKVHLSLPNGGQISAMMAYDRVKAERIQQLLAPIEAGNLRSGDIKLLGEELKTVLLPREIARQFEQIYRTLAPDEGLRIRLIFESNVDGLDRLPWEYLYHSALNVFLSSDPRLTLSRYAPPGPEGIHTMEAEQRLRILLIVSKPQRDSDGHPLGGVLADKVKETVRGLATLERVEEATVLEEPTREAVSNAIEDQKPHIIHYYGHGKFESLVGKLALLRKDGKTADWCSAADFSALFTLYPPLLVILEACESGRAATIGSISVASQLIHQHNTPAVVAMQYEVTNQTAIKFAQVFYRRLTQADPIDVAVQRARWEITFLERPRLGVLGHEHHDFGIPVLFTRNPNPVLFLDRPVETLLRTRFALPYRKYVSREYVADREKAYEKELEHRSVVSIWGDSGTGKTWVGVKLAIQWEQRGFSFSPYPGSPPRQAFWFDCQEDTTFHEVVFGIAEYLKQQDISSLWHWLQSDPNQTKNPKEIIDRLAELLNQRQHLLCFDDFHHIDNNPDIQALFEELERKLDEGTTKTLLISQRKPEILMTGGARLNVMTETEIQSLLLALSRYGKEWLNAEIAERFAHRLIDLVGRNLKLIDIAAVSWLRTNTTAQDAEQYLRSLDKAKIAESVLRHQDTQANLLTTLSMLDDWEERSTIIEIAQNQKGISTQEYVQAFKTLVDVRLVEENAGRYRLHSSVRELCEKIQQEQGIDLPTFNRNVATIQARKGNIPSAVNHYLKAGAFSKAIRLLSDNTIEIMQAGKAQVALDFVYRLQKMTLDEQDELWGFVLLGDLLAWFGKVEAAWEAVQDGLKLLNRTANREDPEIKYLEGRLRVRLGTLLVDMGDARSFKDAMDNLTQGEELLQDYRLAQARHRDSRAHEWLRALYNLGMMYRVHAGSQEGDARAGSFERAIEHYRKCVSRAELLRSQERRASWTGWGLIGLGQVYADRNEKGDRKQAIAIVQDGLSQFTKTNHQWGIAVANNTLGTIYLRLDKSEEAIEYYRQALEAARKCENNEIIVLSNVEIAKVLRHNWSEAREYINAARETLGRDRESWLFEYLSLLECWLQGIKFLQEGKPIEGENLLQSVLSAFREQGHEFDPEAGLVERDLKGFGCSVPSLE